VPRHHLIPYRSIYILEVGEKVLSGWAGDLQSCITTEDIFQILSMAVSSEMEASAEATKEPTPPTTSLKRKSSIAEIEVDLRQPEPPSKKARRALKKGKPLPAKPRSDEEEEDDEEPANSRKTTSGVTHGEAQEPEDVAKPAKKKKERTPWGVWIGNLPFHTSRKDLRQLLVSRSGGSIEDDAIARIKIPLKEPKRKGKQDKSSKKDAEDNEDEAKGKNGKIAENRGFAYVDFTTQAAQIAALALSETETGGRSLLIKDSKSFEGRPEKPAEPKPVLASEIGTAGPNASNADGQKDDTAANRKVFIGNLSFETTEDDVWYHFAKCGAIQWVKIATFEDSGKCKGYGWVKFAEPAGAAWAVKGFVKIKEEIEPEEGDDVEEEQTEDPPSDKAKAESDDEAEAIKPKKPEVKKRFKTRKWKVDILKGRTLKIEMAEDDQVRYKKRFGKGAVGRKAAAAATAAQAAQSESLDTASGDSRPTKKGPKQYAKKPSQADITAARLMGTAMAPQGVKVSLE
jgi:RNA recognition motif-containing protein